MAYFDFEKLIEDVFAPQQGEKILLMTDIPHGDLKINKSWQDRLELGEEWHIALSAMAKKHGFIVMPLMKFAATGQDNKPLPESCTVEGKQKKTEDVISSSDIVISITEFSATAPLIALTKKAKIRGASMPGLTKDMENTALSADYRKIAKRCAVLTPKLTESIGAEILFSIKRNLPDSKVVFSAEYRLYLDLRKRKAHSDDGDCHDAGIIINLPGGESGIVPYEGEDKTLGKSRSCGLLPAYLDKKIRICEIDENRIISIRDEEGNTDEKWQQYFKEDPARANIAELGLGLNDRAVVRGIILEDEKTFLHIAYGRSEHLGGVTGPDAFSKPENIIHEDIVYPKTGEIKIDALYLIRENGVKEIIIKNSEYVL